MLVEYYHNKSMYRSTQTSPHGNKLNAKQILIRKERI